MLHLIILDHLPRRLAKVKRPPCLTCLLGNSRRRPWRSRAAPNHITSHQPYPSGSSVSVDQPVSSTPGIKPQHAVKLTSTPIVGAQLFYDHSSSPPSVHCHLFENFTLEETLKSKVDFERISATYRVTILHYHGGNRRFADDGFIRSCVAYSQTNDFFRVNTHFQNCIAEGNIGHVQSSTCTILLNATRHWPEMIYLERWTLAMLEDVRISNHTRFDADGRPSIAHFSRSDTMLDVKEEKNWFIVFVLGNTIQSGHKDPKRDPRFRVGMHVGKSSFHAFRL